MKKGGFDRAAFKSLYEMEEDSFWFNARNKLIQRLIAKYSSNFNKYLEIGCGTGFVFNGIKNKFPGRNYLGTELFDEGLYYAKKRMPDIEFLKMDALDLNYENQFDLIGSFDVLEHIKEDVKVLTNMFNACDSKGRIIITVPQHMSLWSKADTLACHVRRYSRSELVGKVKKVGFEIDYVSGFVSLLFQPCIFKERLCKPRKAKLKRLNPIQF